MIKNKVARGLELVVSFDGPPSKRGRDTVVLGTDAEATPRKTRRRRGFVEEYPVVYALVDDNWDLHDAEVGNIPAGARPIHASGWFATRR